MNLVQRDCNECHELFQCDKKIDWTLAVCSDCDKPKATTFVWTSRSQPRDPETGAISFDISFDVETSDDWSRIPITALIDFDDLTFAYQEVADAVNHWVNVAKAYPRIRRNCICCNNRTIKSKILCLDCIDTYGPAVDAK